MHKSYREHFKASKHADVTLPGNTRHIAWEQTLSIIIFLWLNADIFHRILHIFFNLTGRSCHALVTNICCDEGKHKQVSLDQDSNNSNAMGHRRHNHHYNLHRHAHRWRYISTNVSWWYQLQYLISYDKGILPWSIYDTYLK